MNKYLYLILLFILLNSLSAFSINIAELRLGTDAKYNDMMLTPTFDKFNLSGMGLKGNVYSVVFESQDYQILYGDTVFSEPKILKKCFFDENKNLKKELLYSKSELDCSYFYTINNDSIYIISPGYSSGPSGRLEWEAVYKIVKNQNGQLIELLGAEGCFKFEGEEIKPHKIQTFEYTSDGFNSNFWKSSANKTLIKRKANTISIIDETSPFNTDQIIIYLNNQNLPVKIKATSSLMKGGAERIYKYNSHNDIVCILKKDKTGETPLYKFLYEYDNNGNWIKKKTYKGNKLSNIVLRDITYKLPEEIAEIEKEAETEFNNLILQKAQNYTNKFISEKQQNLYRNFDIFHSALVPSNSVIENFSIANDEYSFEIPGSENISNIKFYKKYDDLYISEGDSIILKNTFSLEEGPQWSIIVLESIFDPLNEIDWIKEYKETFGNLNPNEIDHRDEWEEEAFFDDLINKKWDEINDIKNHHYGYTGTIYIINTPYENGFVSPDIADKAKEKEKLEAYRAQKEFDDRLDQIYKLLKTEEKEIANIKKFKVDEWGGPRFASNARVYSFKLNDNISHNEMKFYDIREDKRMHHSKHSNQRHNIILVSEDGDFAIFVLDRASWWNTKKPVLVFDLKNNIVNYISGKDWDKMHTHK